MDNSSNTPPKHGAKLTDTHIRLAHGNGGVYMRELIEWVFAAHLSAQAAGLDTEADAVQVGALPGAMYISVDGFAVTPLEFPGGNIGSLAVHGTVNDLAVAGATPRYLTLSAILEEGLEVAVLERCVVAMAEAAQAAGVMIVAGDTKVVPRGHGGGIYFATTGVGQTDPGLQLHMNNIEAGDVVLVSGSVGDHGAAVMLAREDFGLHGDLLSDSASVLPLVKALSGLSGVHFLRDPTRGGLATVAYEIANATGSCLRLQQNQIPVRDSVSSICEILGYDPLYLACEGRVVAVVKADVSAIVLQRWQQLPAGKDAAIIGRIESAEALVLLETPLGGERVLEALEDDPLPRIC
ncbi:hydrogenase expression/formation protein HypE [Candidatus Venteria ishoeyi]|uniref:hydrogenase expression/formation protein HypE n=1 Tax=Candidatus Venteria ishoeyi TaxID=1899563 RepID=UPI0025A5A9DB|nr:hydrogenase expression/formation protein HypE [Candidatus Venteria ishoeyi]MDM8547995.1 hydrogenase expression/formation protein HypE [Candidatus Venteria ishoeyi]